MKQVFKALNQIWVTHLCKACEILVCRKAETGDQSWVWVAHLKAKLKCGITGKDSWLH